MPKEHDFLNFVAFWTTLDYYLIAKIIKRKSTLDKLNGS